MPLCNSCGKGVDESDRFCRYCGALQGVAGHNVVPVPHLESRSAELNLLSPRRYFLPFTYFFWCWLVITTIIALVSGGSFPVIQGFTVIGLVGIAITLTFALMAHANMHHRNCVVWLIACVLFSVYIAGLIYVVTMVFPNPRRGLRL
jgi:hypothetical protein